MHRLLSLVRLLRIATPDALRIREFYVISHIVFSKLCFSIIGSFKGAGWNGLDCAGTFCERLGSFRNSLECFGSVSERLGSVLEASESCAVPLAPMHRRTLDSGED